MDRLSRAGRQGRLIDEAVLVASSVIVTALLFFLYRLAQVFLR